MAGKPPASYSAYPGAAPQAAPRYPPGQVARPPQSGNELLLMLNQQQQQQQQQQMGGGLDFPQLGATRRRLEAHKQQEFNISDQDFPVLGNQVNAHHPQQQQQQQQQHHHHQQQQAVRTMPPPGMQGYGQPPPLQRTSSGSPSSSSSSSSSSSFAAPSASSGASSSSPPKSEQQQRFGVLGLLPVIRMSDPQMNSLTLGTDLTALGLNLNSPEPLWCNFTSPWGGDSTPTRPQLPESYSITDVPPIDQALPLMQDEALIYVFYANPRDILQLKAASHLFQRGWRYHMELQRWLLRVPGSEPLQKTATHERGSFFCWELATWERVRNDNFLLEFSKLEGAPKVPEEEDTR